MTSLFTTNALRILPQIHWKFNT